MPENTLLENYVVKLDTRLTGLEDGVQKLTTILNKVVNDLAVFDFKQDQNVRVAAKLEEMIDKAQDKITVTGSDFLKECDKREARLNSTLDAYKNQAEKVSGEQKTAVDSDIKALDDSLDKLRDQFNDLQRWIWTAIGGGGVLVFVVEFVTNGGLKALGL